MNESLASCAIEETDGPKARLGRGSGLGRLLERGTERGPLRAIAHGGGARLPHVFLGGLDVGHDETLPGVDEATAIFGGRKLDLTIVDVKAPHGFDIISRAG